jgi:hypothetical protein
MHRTTRTPYLIAIFLPVILFACNVVKGQSSTSGAIRGIVSDPQGAVLPGSKITVTSQATAAKRTVISDGNGGYAVGLLPPGIYTVTFEADGFKTVLPPPVTVIVTETTQLNASMVVGDKGETVEVTAGAALLQSENSTLRTLVDSKTIQAVPLTTRNYTQVLTMSPGVASDPNSAASLGKGTPDVYVNGGSNISNSFHMDGADINNFGSGRAGDFVQQAGIASQIQMRCRSSRFRPPNMMRPMVVTRARMSTSSLDRERINFMGRSSSSFATTFSTRMTPSSRQAGNRDRP